MARCRFARLAWALCHACLQATVASPAVNVDMKAAFSAPPYLLELLETAASENETAYFPLVDCIASGRFATARSDAQLYTAFLDVFDTQGYISSPEALATFDLALSLRATAPRIEAHYQYYSTAVEAAVSKLSCQNDWVWLDGKQYCSSSSLDEGIRDGLFSTKVKELPFDRTLGAGPDAILYADMTSNSFAPLHTTLSRAARQLGLRYRIRYRHSTLDKAEPLTVSGYGVDISLKRTDYIVIDDRAAEKDGLQKPLASAAFLDDNSQAADIRPLSTSELALLGMKTASFILESENRLETLIKLTKDFPKYSFSIVAHNVSADFAAEYEQHRADIGRGGINFVWINGLQLAERQIEAFALVQLLRRERKLMDSVRDIGLHGKQAVSLLGHRAIVASKSNKDPLRYDWTDRSEFSKAIIWLNNIEEDARYQEYPTSLNAFLQYTHPGQLPAIRRNVFHIVIPADLTESQDLAFVNDIMSLMTRGIPIRFGLVPLTLSANAMARAQVLYHLAASYDTAALATYIKKLSHHEGPESEEKLVNHVMAYEQLLPGAQKSCMEDVIRSESYLQQTEMARKWVDRLNADGKIRSLLVNGIPLPLEGEWMHMMGAIITQDLQTIQKGIFQGIIDEETDIAATFLQDAVKRRNAYVSLDDDKALDVLDVSKMYHEHADLLAMIPVLGSCSNSSKDTWAVLTVFADVTNVHGMKLVTAALDFKRSNPGLHVEIVHNPKDDKASSRVNSALKSAERLLPSIDSVEALSKIIDMADGLQDLDGYWTMLSRLHESTNVSPGASVVMLNGRLVGPLAANVTLTPDDLQQLFEFEHSRRILPVFTAMDSLGLSDKLSSPHAAAKITSMVARSTMSDIPEGIFDSAPSIRSTPYDSWNSTHSAIEIGDAETASIHIVGLLDPASDKGQRWAPIFAVLSELKGVYVKLILNPQETLTELPIKSFYRHVMESKPSFDQDGNVMQLRATFRNLPSEALLTTAIHVPPAWLVAPSKSVHDLDNIKLSTARADIDATYKLEHILIQGHSREDQGVPPRGAQLVLATEKNPLITDTIIMANLGFFQFKANPGFYKIELKQGRSAQIYTFESTGAHGWEAVAGDQGNELVLMDFQGATLYPRLKRRAGMQDEDVLEPATKPSGDSLLSRGLELASHVFNSASSPRVLSVEAHADINIFTVASGHLYERMLNIMMVSVMRNTKRSVKFWFIEQFLSPSFKDFIPYLANEYGFKYEMVTYKWPHWLRQQKEKQREIWGYKILFLDVLFPLSLDKVIFVDADQVVRTDMMDLIKLDLEGAPYGFTPMCDSRTEMEGFRFWKQGYWASYLRGRPYHISALYVVDLRRFRELAAGDRLRQQYHALSADPNSLSNLDQDLPNHMQFQIPIHSLPQDWLWCETWCSDESLASARTIDLCNNPQTKEPKLDRARRQVPEWTIYDDEIAALDATRRQQPQNRAGLKQEQVQVQIHMQNSHGEGSHHVNTMSRNWDELKLGQSHTIDEL
ncbi:hypothetical protein CDD81_4273 [Ophiocordyceps australis]|uniref:UDP-glucose:glycoprotein glucosyltransferase n=1 Tax=Ophiocordyceps australis TaxID=1399860 RepID=A0A2C5XNL7_9HYPO|nr:hypothetical protein CDD81_4273 [Ophiocordyceps australis]